MNYEDRLSVLIIRKILKEIFIYDFKKKDFYKISMQERENVRVRR